ncbi:succinyl-CoA synthetase beta subunit [Desulfohalotomaculum tongense]|uniref:ADP-forming succinate--CoA ligase subunit beta n=1 Tax=Desulforadius tongensis TaxID=1216062 RepID=UPI001958E50B|nr:ADP-forming succinate--CoA ligase subunit beta [Desulforadius tongensis]MBM7854757.1 succinyl-CoA synthetase beta subunit [Desulforadius tongensis]
MKLFEYMGKKLFKKFDIAVPKGEVFFSGEGIEQFTARLGDVVVKSQVLSGGRGKAGGIKFASTPGEAREAAEELLRSEVKGCPVKAVLVEEKLPIDRELYLAVTVDGALKRPVVIASADGGVDIEALPEDKIVKIPVDVHIGVQPHLGRETARQLSLAGDYLKQFTDVLVKLYRLFRSYDCELVEINPLAISNGKFIAVDAKVTVDDEAAFRYPADLPAVDERTEREKRAHELGISYVELCGDIAVMANGAGITMATLDIINHYGGTPRNFMDAGGGAGTEATARALEILLSTRPKVILANIFGGITRCDEVANAFVQVKEKLGISVPLVIRLMGTNEKEGVRILQRQNIESFRTVQEAVAKAVELAAGREGSGI